MRRCATIAASWSPSRLEADRALNGAGDLLPVFAFASFVVGRIRFAVLAIIGWIILLVITIAGHPHGNDWFFLIVAPFYFAFFVQQIRRARADRQT
jgi:hypothetical protein